MSARVKQTDNSKCVRCNCFLRKTIGTKTVIRTDAEATILSHVLNKAVIIGDKLCDKCRRYIRVPIKKTSDTKKEVEKYAEEPGPSGYQGNTTSLLRISSSSSDNDSITEDVTDDQTFAVATDKSTHEKKVSSLIEMPFCRTVSTHKYCILCSNTNHLVTIPFNARIQAFMKRKIFIPKGNRCCAFHLIKERFFEEELNNLRIYSNMSAVETEELAQFMEHLSLESNSSIINKIGELSLSEDRIKVLTGLTWEDLTKLSTAMVSMRNTESRNILQALVVFLFKLRSGSPNNVIASVFGLKYEQQVSDFCTAVVNAFEKDILPFHFGAKAMSRDELIINHTAPMARKLYNIKDELALIFDGTYIYHQKSSNNEYQRKAYSGQKKRPLCKPFTICTTDGYVVDIIGPFTANKNDAEILKTVLLGSYGLKNLLKKGDIIIVDRGFRDIKEYLEEQGYIVLMPALKGHRSQLTTEESNKSRKVTKLRWVVEAVHGAIRQKYRLLYHQLQNKLLPKLGSYCRIACFLLNTFGKRLNSDDGMLDEVAAQIESRETVDNTLALEVEEQGWQRKKLPFQSFTSSDVLDFPELTEKDLKILFTGSYQLSQAVSYLAEMLNKDNSINLWFLKEKPDIIKIQVQSRHIRSKTYKSYIHYKPYSAGYTGILRYCCDCANGRRTIGCCSHVAAVIYYLSHARYLSNIVRPAEILSKLFKYEEIDPVINVDSDDD